MSENVVGIRGAPVPQVMAPSDDVVSMLEDLLERAKSGDILGVSAVYQHNDETCGLQRAGLVSFRLLGFATAMVGDMHEDLKKL